LGLQNAINSGRDLIDADVWGAVKVLRLFRFCKLKDAATRAGGAVNLGVVVLVALALASCQSAPPPRAPSAALSVPDSTSSLRSGDLRVAPFDVLEIKVFGVSDLDGPYQVDPEGMIKIPLIGGVNAKGYTIFELARIIEGKLGESFLQDPQVSVRVSEAFGRQITVEGSVEKPGIYPVKGDITLLQALAVSGGTNECADERRVAIFRTIEGARQAAVFDVRAIREGKAEDPQVFGNDIIVVDGSTTRTAYQEFLRAIPFIGLFVYAR
jgi:polysaccharide export outer membrane protein